MVIGPGRGADAAPFASDADAAHAARFFAERPDAGRLWGELAKAATAWGPVHVTATKSRVCLKARTRFLWCPQANLDGSIYVRFWYPMPLFEPSAWQRLDSDAGGRVSHRVHITTLAPEVLTWFRAAYDFDVGK